MTDLARLQIRVDSLEAEVADRRLKGLTGSGARAERATDGLTASFKRFLGPAVAAAGAVTALRKTISITREFEVLNAQLITATGSAESAGVAFEAIQDFASSTPYDLQQVTEGFVKLVNLGLTPSEAALTSYGNTASAMGKDLNQLIEAVADAATGEFERLKEFGIRAKSQGDQVSFTFRGVTTTVGKNAAEIEAYLQALGENEFAGAMQQRVETLDGALSNLGDEWDKLFLNISNLGVGDLIEDSVRVAIDVLEEVNAILASGQFEAYLDALGSKFEGLGQNIAFTLDTITGVWNDFLGTEQGQGLAGATNETLAFIVEAFKNLPENIKSIIELIGVEIASLIDYGRFYGEAFGRVLGAEFAKIVEKSKAYGTAIGQALNPFDDDTFNLEEKLRQLDDISASFADEEFARADKRAEIIREARRSSIISIIEERDAALASFDRQIAAADELRRTYDQQIEARRNAGGDRLEAFRTGADPEEDTETDSQRKAREAREKEFERLRLSLRTEEEAIQESYDNRLAIILQNTEEGSKQQIALKEKLDRDFATQAIGDLAAPNTFEEQLTEIETFYEARRNLILENTALTEEQRTALELDLTKQRNEKIRELEQQRTSLILNSSSQLFGGLADLAKGYAGEQSSTYRALFAASKAFAIAESIIKIQQGIANAASLPFPANLGAIGTVISATSSILSTINGTEFSGAYDAGGRIPSGGIGLVGEYGPELVEGPAQVRSRKETAEMFREGKNQSQGAPQMQNNIRIVNNVDPEVFEDFLGSSRGEELIMNTIRKNPESVRAISGSAA